ncbi:uncharacterized protein LOC123563560 [Mercenaria mercenaria]|uniref:uncharacterized protein LOC123563560 n=1 Tax=Mercenaria mercenaria TaxID=6596 RepID=UPI00234F2891|nr:uncharacterized protein LOC123563560 [Mercenaria mercenaria]XP_045212351.2 uncharacterized protein LOC123563560 [Mercenaria mercenaria]
MPSRICYLNLTILCLFLSFGAQLIGFSVPGWLHIIIYPSQYTNENTVSQNFALWYAVICWDGMCRTKSYTQLKEDRIDVADDKYGFHHTQDLPDYDFTARYSRFQFSRLLEFQIEAVCALVIVLLGLILMRTQKKRLLHYMSGKREEEPKQSTYCMVFCYAVVSGGLILVPASQFIGVNEDLVTDNFKLGMPYALICSGSGGLLALFSCLLIVRTMCKSVTTSDIYNSESNGEGLNDTTNVGHQLVPLVPLETQSSGMGYVDPVVPGYEPSYGNVSSRTIVTISNSEERNGSRYTEGRGRVERDEGAINSHNSGYSQNYEQPPPSYEECMKHYCNPPW